MEDLHGIQGERTLLAEGPLVMLTSLGFQSCGLLCLNNYPNFLRDVAPENVDGTPRADRVDLAALESEGLEDQGLRIWSSGFKAARGPRRSGRARE